MLNIKRWNELKDLEQNNPEELLRLAKELGIKVENYARDITAIDVLTAENRRDHPEMMKNIDAWFK